MKNQLPSILQLTRVVSQFLHRFHIVLFVVLAVGSLSLVALFLNQALSQQADDISAPTEDAFDQATMDKISKLRTSSERSDLQLPNSRTNPFK